jgi:hypothetical protein
MPFCGSCNASRTRAKHDDDESANASAQNAQLLGVARSTLPPLEGPNGGGRGAGSTGKARAEKSLGQKIDQPIRDQSKRTDSRLAAATRTNRQYVHNQDPLFSERPGCLPLFLIGRGKELTEGPADWLGRQRDPIGIARTAPDSS